MAFGLLGVPKVGVNGRGDWTRTSDPLTPSQVRYRAALRPDLPNGLILLVFWDSTRKRKIAIGE